MSWTQIDMWLRNRERYIGRYMLGGADFSNSGMEFGKRTSEALDGEWDDDELMAAVVALLPKYPMSEAELRAELTTKDGKVELLGKLDRYDPKAPRFREVKTGRTVWTQAKAQKHKQMHHYATLIWMVTGKVPKEAWLDWAQTELYQGEVVFTGQIRSFRVKLGMADILAYMSLAGRVAREIDVAYRAELKRMT